MALPDDLLVIKIPIPTITNIDTIKRGKRSTTQGGKIDIRYSEEELKLVEEAARLLELKTSTFVRLCSMYAAKQIKEHSDAHQQHNGGG